MKSRDIAIVGILLAIGAILRFVFNMFPGAIVGNPVIALYCLAIILIRPTMKEAVGIGLVAGVGRRTWNKYRIREKAGEDFMETHTVPMAHCWKYMTHKTASLIWDPPQQQEKRTS